MKVLVSGYYGFGNLGDEALLQGLVRGLEAHGHRVTVLSHAPQRTRELHSELSSVGAIHRLRGLLPALLTHDALVSGGGGLLQDKTSQRSLDYYLGVIRLGKALGKRVVVYGQSVGPLSEEGRARVARALRGVPVAVRDGASQTLLGKLGVEAHLVADAALTLPAPRENPPKDAPVLLIPRGGYPELTGALGTLAEELEARAIPVATLAFHPQEDDGEVVRIAERARVVRHEASTPDEALRRVAASSYVVSARLHGLILAAVAGRGFSGLAYDPKVAAFLDEAGAPAHGQTPDVQKLLQEAETRAVGDPQRLAALRERAAQGFDWLEHALTQTHSGRTSNVAAKRR